MANIGNDTELYLRALDYERDWQQAVSLLSRAVVGLAYVVEKQQGRIDRLTEEHGEDY